MESVQEKKKKKKKEKVLLRTVSRDGKRGKEKKQPQAENYGSKIYFLLFAKIGNPDSEKGNFLTPNYGCTF
jgi:hypothetical protein